ncbi:L,D-transpeptidase [Streptomyces sodiiphilus]
MSHGRLARSCALILAPLLAGLTGCGNAADRPLAVSPQDASDHVSFGPAGKDGARVDPDEPLRITTQGSGRLTDVSVADAAGRPLAGEMAADGSSWRSTAPLAAGARYTVEVRTERGDGTPGVRTHAFRTRPAEGDRLEVSFGPQEGTYGVGQPVTAELSEEISDAAERTVVEEALTVRSRPRTEGAWHWVDDKLLHYRPKDYWPAHATITVESALDGVRIRKGLRGAPAETLRLRTGDRIEAVADIQAHTMTVRRNGEVLRTLPITTGKAGFRTRNGKKVILTRESFVRMRGTSIGIPAGSAESYDLPVYWATRLTWSGEYVHGAPWSAGSHGSANVSHGCTGLSSENARWFFELVRPGDIVEHINGYGEDMAPFGNGFGDWNLSWDAWREGSALEAARTSGSAATGRSARLRPLL